MELSYHKDSPTPAGILCRYHSERIKLRLLCNPQFRSSAKGYRRLVGREMKLFIAFLIAFTALLFGMGAFIGGTIAMRPYIEQAKLSKIETDNIIAMSLQDLSNVTIPQRVL